MKYSSETITPNDLADIRQAQHQWRVEKRRELEKKARKRQFKEQQQHQHSTQLPISYNPTSQYTHNPADAASAAAAAAAAAAASPSNSAVTASQHQNFHLTSDPNSILTNNQKPSEQQLSASNPNSSTNVQNVALEIDAATAAAAAAAHAAATANPGQPHFANMQNSTDQHQNPSGSHSTDRIRMEQLEAQRQWRINKRKELELKRLRGTSSKRGRKKTKLSPSIAINNNNQFSTYPSPIPLTIDKSNQQQPEQLSLLNPSPTMQPTESKIDPNLIVGSIPLSTPATLGALKASASSSLPYATASTQLPVSLPSTSRPLSQQLSLYPTDSTSLHPAASMPFVTSASYLHSLQQPVTSSEPITTAPMPSTEQMESIIPTDTKLDYVDLRTSTAIPPASLRTLSMTPTLSNTINPSGGSEMIDINPTATDKGSSVLQNVSQVVNPTVENETTTDANSNSNIDQVQTEHITAGSEQLLEPETDDIGDTTHENDENIANSNLNNSELVNAHESNQADTTNDGQEATNENTLNRSSHEQASEKHDRENENTNDTNQVNEHTENQTNQKDDVATDGFQSVSADLIPTDTWQAFDNLGNA